MRRTATTSFNILTVDDDAVTRALLHAHLLAAGHGVISVESAAMAMAVIETEPVHIVVADWLMPQMSGLDLLRWVRQRPLTPQPHFVMLTANTGQEQLVEAFDAGVDDFLSKPFNEVELMARLQAWTRLVALQKEANQLAGELRGANELLVQLASRDDLTGLTNRRAAMEQLESCIGLARRHGHPLTCALIDVDHFKEFNDVHGHATGDYVLKHLAQVLRRSTRATDVSCRIGGDEFLVILSHTSLDAAKAWATKFADTLAVTPVQHKQLALSVTVSIGLKCWTPSTTIDELLDSTDRVLYEAKGAGRGVVCARG
ncbi:MAG TPA: diguanylate cyclase [Tepidisphaeraceae bacterium]|jgi:diguanylate cyclase (GGDEF)-like protein|nr:diguanylate cyclase [Tepidisphaeraceae bacterium]